MNPIKFMKIAAMLFPTIILFSATITRAETRNSNITHTTCPIDMQTFAPVEFSSETNATLSSSGSPSTKENSGPGCCDKGEEHYYTLDGLAVCTGRQQVDGVVYEWSASLECKNTNTFCTFSDHNGTCERVIDWCITSAENQGDQVDPPIFDLDCTATCISTAHLCPESEVNELTN